MNDKKWVAGWGAATDIIAQNHADYFKDQTFRWVFFSTMDASAVRIHFSNRFGTEDCTLTRATIAASAGDHKIITETLMPITFEGKSSLTMKPGNDYLSDPISFKVSNNSYFTLSLYFENFTQLLTGHSNNGYYIKKYYSKGDMTSAQEIPLQTLGENGPYVFINTIDFLTDASKDSRAIVAFGDSITAQPWPDCLAHRFESLGIENRSVIRRGIGGNRVLRDYDWRMKKHWGPAGIKRFEKEVTETAGADRVFALHGINDILHPSPKGPICPMSELPTAEEIENGLAQYVDISHRHGMKIYLATILPCPRIAPLEGDRENIRVAVNKWIRESSGADGVIDFESAVMDPENPKAMLPLYDSGDHLHPSFDGAQQMANSIPVEFLI